MHQATHRRQTWLVRCEFLNGKPASSCAASETSCKYFDATAFKAVSATSPGLLDGFFGNAGRNILRGPGFFNLDMSVTRDFKLSERFTFQFEADALGLRTRHTSTIRTPTSAQAISAL